MAKMVVTERRREIEEFIYFMFWQCGISYENECDDILYVLFSCFFFFLILEAVMECNVVHLLKYFP